jgi:hypothetical protein
MKFTHVCFHYLQLCAAVSFCLLAFSFFVEVEVELVRAQLGE